MFYQTLISISDINITEAIFFLVGGLGIFLYGIDFLGECLKKLAGDKLKMIIEKSTSTPLKGIIVGIVVTVLIQSSSATTAITIGLVRTGLMTFVQAVGIILGANIGTTITSFLIGLDIGALALPIIGLGAAFIFFFKKENIKNLGGAILGFGMIFYGIELMSSGMGPIADTEEAAALFTTISTNPLLGLLVGAIFTAVIQSSSASIGILQSLYPLGVISLRGALPIILGSNIGTTITAVIVSAGGTVETKRTTLVHVLFNTVGAILFMLLLDVLYYPAAMFMEQILINSGMGEHPMMSIALAHAFFNIVMVVITFFFIPLIVKFVEKVIKGEKKSDFIAELIDRNLVKQSSAVALAFVKTCIDDLTNMAVEMTKNVTKYGEKENQELFDLGKKQEDEIDYLEHLIHGYLVELTGRDLNHAESDELNRYLDVIADVERIGDHCDNIFNFFSHRYKTGQTFSPEGRKDIDQLFATLNNMIELTKDAFVLGSKEKAVKVIGIESHIDNFVRKFRKRHIRRISEGICTDSDNYVDILLNIERIGDHCNNICQKIVIEDFYNEIQVEEA